MFISFVCACGLRIKAKDSRAGRTAKCPGCQATVRIPLPDVHHAAVPPPEWGGDWDRYYDLRREFPNRRALVPIEQIEPYWGLMVAWAPDASRIIESAPDYDTLQRRVAALGIDPMLVVFESIPPLGHEGKV